MRLRSLKLTNVTIGLIVTELPEYVSLLGGSKTFLSSCVAAFSFGRLPASIMFGWWSERQGARFVLRVSIFLALLGNLLYCLAASMESKWVLLVGRLLVRRAGYVTYISRYRPASARGTSRSCEHTLQPSQRRARERATSAGAARCSLSASDSCQAFVLIDATQLTRGCRLLGSSPL